MPLQLLPTAGAFSGINPLRSVLKTLCKRVVLETAIGQSILEKYGELIRRRQIQIHLDREF